MKFLLATVFVLACLVGSIYFLVYLFFELLAL